MPKDKLPADAPPHPPPGHGSKWVVIRRSLAILRRLLEGPASRDELIQAVLESVGPEAYPAHSNGLHEAFKRDRENLRDKLEVIFSYDAQAKLYILHNPGPLGYLSLSPANLQALHLLSQTFAGQVGEQVEVRELLEALVDRLSPEARRKLECGSLPVDLDIFRAVDAAPIDARVWEIVHRAVREHRKLAFTYLSPQYADRLPHYHEIAPYRIRFRRGHWYLYGYDLYTRDPHGVELRDTGHKFFRLNRVIADEHLAVLPTVLPPGQRRPPRYWVHYRLLPAIGRGDISRHFDDMQVTRLPDGSAEVQGYTDDTWEAVRILLAYGENCLALGGPEILNLLVQRVKGMAHHYGLVENEE